MEKSDIRVGDQGYLRQFTSNSYINMVKRPVTVVEVSKSRVIVQYCKLIAPVYHCCGNPMLDRPDLEGQRVFFYDTVAESIEPDPDGHIVCLSWHPRRKLWEKKEDLTRIIRCTLYRGKRNTSHIWTKEE